MKTSVLWRGGAFLLPVLPFALLALFTWGQFDGLYGQDPYAYYNYAIGPLAEAMPGLPPPFFWPPGYPLLVWLVTLVVGKTPMAGQIVSLIGGILVVLFTALLAYSLDSRFTIDPSTSSGQADLRLKGSPFIIHNSQFIIPLIAALFVAFTGQLWQSSVVVMADMAALAMATLGVWALVTYGRSHKLPWLLLAAGAISYAVLTRWAYALLAIPVTIYALWVILEIGDWRLGTVNRQSLISNLFIHGGAAALITLLVLSPILVPTLQQATAPEGGASAFAGDLEVYSWNPLNAFRREFVTADGLLSYRFPNGLYYAIVPMHEFYFTPLLSWLILPGLWVSLQGGKWARGKGQGASEERGAKSEKTPFTPPPSSFLLLLSWAAIIYAFHAGAPWQNFRFTLAYLPPMAILAAVGFVAIWQKFPPRLGWIPPLYLVMGLAVMGWGGWQLTNSFIERKEADLTAVAWVESHTPANARLLSLGMTATLQQYSQRETLEIYELTPADLATLMAEGKPTFLFIDVANVEHQWVNSSPGINYRWLRENPGLEELDTNRNFTLFRVGTEQP